MWKDTKLSQKAKYRKAYDMLPFIKTNGRIKLG